MEKIRVAEVITRLDRGGAPDIFRTLSSNLDPAAFDVTLITGPSEHLTKKTKDFVRRFGGRLIKVPSLVRDIDPLRDAKALFSLWHIFREQKFDIVHTHTAKAGALGRLAARLAGISSIVHTPHGHNLYGYFDERATENLIRIERYLSKRTDKIIALTELEKSDYIKHDIAPAEKIEVIYQGLELDRYMCDWKESAELKRGLNILPGENVVGMIGRLETVKGPEYFIDMAAEITKTFPNTKFIIAGDGSLRQELEAKAGKLGIKSKVIFAGWRDDVPEVLSILDILVMPSLNEAVGIAAIEASAEGVSVVATRVGGIPEVVKDNVTGLLVAPADGRALAEAVSTLIQDKAMRDRMGSQGRSWIRGRFDAWEMVNRTSTLYGELFNRKKYGIV